MIVGKHVAYIASTVFHIIRILFGIIEDLPNTPVERYVCILNGNIVWSDSIQNAKGKG